MRVSLIGRARGRVGARYIPLEMPVTIYLHFFGY
jgi:hypothetical protein